MKVDQEQSDKEKHKTQKVQKNKLKGVCNPNQAALVFKIVPGFCPASYTNKNIGIISPYTAQVAMMRLLIKSDEVLGSYEQPSEIDTVDAFQGRERDIIVFASVRANADRCLGHTDEPTRLNVAHAACF